MEILGQSVYIFRKPKCCNFFIIIFFLFFSFLIYLFISFFGGGYSKKLNIFEENKRLKHSYFCNPKLSECRSAYFIFCPGKDTALKKSKD